MVLQIVFRVAFSHRPGGLGHVADCNGIPKNLPTNFHPDLIATILQRCFPLLVGRLFQRCHLSRINEVLKCGDSMTKPHMLSQIPSSCPKIQLSVFAPVPIILISFFSVSCEDFVVLGGLYPLCCQVLYHCSVSMIVSGFTSLIEDFLICRHQVNKLFCSR